MTVKIVGEENTGKVVMTWRLPKEIANEEMFKHVFRGMDNIVGKVGNGAEKDRFNPQNRFEVDLKFGTNFT